MSELQLEMERHRKTWRQLEQVTGLLRDARSVVAVNDATSWTTALLERIDAALSLQAEPKCRTCNDVGIVGHSTICPECEDTWTPPDENAEQQAYVECRECSGCGHVGINDALETNAACGRCAWIGPSPDEDKCPGCAAYNVMSAACPKCGCIYRLLADASLTILPAQAEPAPASTDGVNWKAVANEQKSIIEQLQAKLNAKVEPAPAQDERVELNDWFLSLPRGRQVALIDDKWMLASAAFEAGRTRPAQTEQQPIQVTAVAVLRDDGDGGLEPDWILEGGTAELMDGMVLVVAADGEITGEDGHGEVYAAPQPEQSGWSEFVEKAAILLNAEQARLCDEDYLMDHEDCITVLREHVATLFATPSSAMAAKEE